MAVNIIYPVQLRLAIYSIPDDHRFTIAWIISNGTIFPANFYPFLIVQIFRVPSRKSYLLASISRLRSDYVSYYDLHFHDRPYTPLHFPYTVSSMLNLLIPFFKLYTVDLPKSIVYLHLPIGIVITK